MKQHTYTLTTEWTGNKGMGTTAYDAYERSHIIHIENKADLLCSSDSIFRGDGTKPNPEDFFLASLSSCHMLWYLHLCADAGIIVTAYTDAASAILDIGHEGGGRFNSAELAPHVTVAEEWMVEKANQLHEQAHAKCFIANSVNFPVRHKASCVVQV